MWLFLLACTGTETTPVDTSTPTVDDAGWNVLQLGFHIGQALDAGVPDPEELAEAYLDRFDEGDDDCPGSSDQLTGTVPPEGCTAESGAFYIGVSTWIETNEDGLETWAVGGDFEMVASDGRTFEGGGNVEVYYEDVGVQVSGGHLLGTWRWDGATTGWQHGVSSAMVYVAFDNGDVLFLDGPIQLGEYALDFDELAWQKGCEHPTGGFSIRDQDARWYEVTLDDCSGCGEAVLDGEVLGELCPELDAFKAASLENLAR